MSARPVFVIAGGGLAGAKAAEALRSQGFLGRIVRAAQEEDRPYERPPLSKEYLQGKADRDTIFVHPKDWYDTHDVESLLGTAVTGIGRASGEVTLSDGERLVSTTSIRQAGQCGRGGSRHVDLRFRRHRTGAPARPPARQRPRPPRRTR